jgi:hypothetical protein
MHEDHSTTFQKVNPINSFKVLEMILHTFVIGGILRWWTLAANPSNRKMGPVVNRNRQVGSDTTGRIRLYSFVLIARERDIVDQRPMSTKW